ncbi:putative proline iminopeptidase [Candidatus Terasakiella magnetica]|uniref:Proline iminopeptidase n=1 Tax=Candidatus Terasakiella magnetica TaxID=1867952 RepID=A0A1C3RI91_9PROT|nr:prolyl aminopeptidase [Candidatus Terasakiella magnetica]SCA56998.1 putative proline iminopeptidase [Candidatus Terasakiella magnetica]
MPFTRGSDLFPAITPNQSGMLDVGDGHHVYWEECGNPQGVALIFLHGGPGAGCSSIHRRFFDPKHYRIILMDQRGCGRSTPTAAIENNTTDHLIDDLEQLRTLLEIERWFIFGGSWGSTLALAYGVAHPKRCRGFILRGIFMGQPYECDWFLNRMGTFQPEAARAFSSFLPLEERRDLLNNYIRRLNHPDPDIHLPAAHAWSSYEEACATLLPYHGSSNPDPVSTLCLARLEAHYFKHQFFMEEDYLLNNLHRITHLPCIIVQGRYDTVCPPVTAEHLSQAWAKAQYIVIPDAGHSALESGIRAALINATQAFKAVSD